MRAWRVVGVVASAGLAAYGAAAWYGARRWEAGTRDLRARLQDARQPVTPGAVDFDELRDLPAPVQRYFRAVLRDGQPMVAAVHLRHHGTFNMGEITPRWTSFTSDQWVVTRRPGFDWDARIAMAPGLTVRVHDAYVAGEGLLQAALLGLVPVVDRRGDSDLNEGELMRYLAEATWYPTALLPSQGVRWAPVDDRSARATLTDGPVTLTMSYTFNDEGLVATVRAEARSRAVGNEMVPTPWQGRFWNYQDVAGMRVPLDGEVAWLLPGGPYPYWRGHIADISCEFAR
jgi:hypothetical protein